MQTYKFINNNNRLIKNYCSGVYAIRNDLDNNMYIGSSSNIRLRYNNHLNNLFKGTHSNKKLLEDYNRIGFDKFSFIILECCDDNTTTLKFIENKYIELYGFYNRNKVDGKLVHCYDMIGKYIRSYYNLKLAAKDINGFVDNIRACCELKYSKKSYKNFLWRYYKLANIGAVSRQTVYKGCKTIIQLDKKGNKLNEYISIGLASRSTGIAKSAILSVLCIKKKLHKTAGGYIWKYKKGKNNE